MTGLGDTMAGGHTLGDKPLGWGDTAGRGTHTVRVRGHAGGVRGKCTGRVWGDTCTVKGGHALPLHREPSPPSCQLWLGGNMLAAGTVYTYHTQSISKATVGREYYPKSAIFCSPKSFLPDSPALPGMCLPATEIPFLPSHTHGVHHVDVVHKIPLPKVDSEL